MHVHNQQCYSDVFLFIAMFGIIAIVGFWPEIVKWFDYCSWRER